MNKYNILAVIIVGIAFIYVWKVESTPKPPLDRTVSSKSLTGTNETRAITPPQVTEPITQVETLEDTSSMTDTGSSIPSGLSGSTTLSPEDDDNSLVSNIPP
ncbi:MAG: hypothetical protein PHU93_04190, partial [Candidatus Gracilibacteria bacterium]|nr:hypothetical protein [Candidatus Gracilibacteria bacterium]